MERSGRQDESGGLYRFSLSMPLFCNGSPRVMPYVINRIITHINCVFLRYSPTLRPTPGEIMSQ